MLILADSYLAPTEHRRLPWLLLGSMLLHAGPGAPDGHIFGQASLLAPLARLVPQQDASAVAKHSLGLLWLALGPLNLSRSHLGRIFDFPSFLLLPLDCVIILPVGLGTCCLWFVC